MLINYCKRFINKVMFSMPFNLTSKLYSNNILNELTKQLLKRWNLNTLEEKPRRLL